MIDRPRVAYALQGLMGKVGRWRDGLDVHSIQPGLLQSQCLGREAGVLTREALGRSEIDAVVLDDVLKLLQPALAVGVLQTEEADFLDALALHVGKRALDHQLVRYRRLEGERTRARRLDDGR